MDTLWNVVVPAVAGLVAGAIASLVAPWVQLAVEKRRELVRSRREKLARWREEILSVSDTEINDTVSYSEARPFLKEEIVRALEGGEIPVRRGRGKNLLRDLVLDDLSRVEREWDLV